MRKVFGNLLIGAGAATLLVSAVYWSQGWRYGLVVLIWGATLGLMLLGPGLTLRWIERPAACLAGGASSLLSATLLLWWTRTVGSVGAWLWIFCALDVAGIALRIYSYGRRRRH